MGKSKIAVIIAREFSVRVKKKSFIITTVLAPVLMAGLLVVPALITMYSGNMNENLTIKVADRSGVVMPYLERDTVIRFEPIPEDAVDEQKKNIEESGAFAILEISPLDSSKNVSIQAYSVKQIDVETRARIRENTREAIKQYKLKSYDIPELEQMVNDIETDVKIDTFEIDPETGKEKAVQVEIYMAIGYIASFMIYMFIFMFGSMVMRSVIEEKTTRIVEVIVSSVKPFELMMGKILGVASVALTQFLIWIVLTIAIVFGATAAMGSGAVKGQTELQAQLAAGGMAQEQLSQVVQMPDAAQDASDSGAFEIIDMLREMDIASIVGCFLIYFALGYLLYASLFAAVGASVDNEADTQQLILPVTIPLIIGLFIMLHTFQYPDSALSFWGSVIPFTSPMVMMARVAYGVPGWQLALSVGLLAATFLGIAYLSGKIYRTGILVYGKKVSWKDLMKWIKR